MINILICDDEINMTNLLTSVLTKSNYITVAVHNGTDAIDAFNEYNFDLMIVDIGLPDIEGHDVVEYIRQYSDIPILFLTAKKDINEKVKAFNLGADDYLVKPFNIEELKLRIKALLKRTNKESILSYQNVTFHDDELSVSKDELKQYLSKKEYCILKYLVNNHGKTLTREQIIENCYGFDEDVTNRTIDSHIRYIRKKLQLIGTYDFLISIRGFGYKVN